MASREKKKQIIIQDIYSMLLKKYPNAGKDKNASYYAVAEASAVAVLSNPLTEIIVHRKKAS